jgi:hypothetical protein
MARGLLFDVQNPATLAMNQLGGASQSYAAMTKKGTTQTTEPIKSTGEGLMYGVGGALAASGIGSALTSAGAEAAGGAVGGPWGMAAGAAIGLLSYFLT